MNKLITDETLRTRERTRRYQYRIYPNKDQIEKIHQSIGCSRAIYNTLVYTNNQIAIARKTYPDVKYLSMADAGLLITHMRNDPDTPWYGIQHNGLERLILKKYLKNKGDGVKVLDIVAHVNNRSGKPVGGVLLGDNPELVKVITGGVLNHIDGFDLNMDLVSFHDLNRKVESVLLLERY